VIMHGISILVHIRYRTSTRKITVDTLELLEISNEI
jgi:hypothetical protein